MQTNNLHFIHTFTVEQFKSSNLVKELRVKKNPKTGSLFFTYGSKVGAVSSKGIPTEPMISLVNGSINRKPTDEELQHIGNANDEAANGFFYILHNEGHGAETLATF